MERTISREAFRFPGQNRFHAFDSCESVKCSLLIDHGTEQLAFTSSVFKDCNIDRMEPDEAPGLYVRDNFFDRPLEQRRSELRPNWPRLWPIGRQRRNEGYRLNRTAKAFPREPEMPLPEPSSTRPGSC